MVSNGLSVLYVIVAAVSLCYTGIIPFGAVISSYEI